MPPNKQGLKIERSHNFQEEINYFVEEFEKQTQLQIMKMEAEAKLDIKSFETFVDLMLSRLPLEIRQMSLREIVTWNNEKENSNAISSLNNRKASTAVKATKRPKRGTTISDDGYDTEGTTIPLSISQITNNTEEIRQTRAMRSSSRNSRVKKSEITRRTVTKAKIKNRTTKFSIMQNEFKTPAIPKLLNNEFGIITPKVKPNLPLNILRRPCEGEMAVSMQGSPLLVSTIISDKTANINVPLSNGNIMSLLPNKGLRMSTVPTLDPETIYQLEVLKNHIEKVISLKKPN